MNIIYSLVVRFRMYSLSICCCPGKHVYLNAAAPWWSDIVLLKMNAVHSRSLPCLLLLFLSTE